MTKALYPDSIGASGTETRTADKLFDALSLVHRAVVHCPSLEQLFEEITSALVTDGLVDMAWIGWRDEKDGPVAPVARTGGTGDFPAQFHIVDGDSADGLRVEAKAFRSGQAEIRDDLLKDAAHATSPRRPDQSQWRAAAAFPIRHKGVVKGVLGAYARQPSYFRDERILKLLATAADLSHALDRLARNHFLQQVNQMRAEVDRARQEVDRALEESEQRYLQVFRASPNPKALIELESRRIVDVNDDALALFGYSREEAIGMHTDRIYLPADLAKIEKRRATMKAGELPRTRDFKLVRKDGSVFDAEILTRIIELNGRRLALSVVRDVSDLVAALELARESQRRYRTLFDASPDPLMLIDSETGQIAEVNEAALAQYGYSRQEIDGMNVDKFFREEDLPRIEEFRREVAKNSSLRVSGLKLIRKDGSTFDVEVVSKALDIDGQHYRFSLVRDVTPRLEAERKLQESRRHYQAMFEASPEALALVDSETRRILDVNEAATRQFRYDRETMIGMSADRLFRSEDLAKVRQERERPAIDSVRLSGEFRLVRRDGTYFDAEISTREFELEGKRVALSVARDMSERNRAEERRLAAEEQLFQSQKMEAVGQLTGGVAHDFNNLLTVILANVEELLEDDRLTPERREMLRDISESGERAADLTQRLLAFSRKQRLSPQPTNINDLVSSLSKLLRRTLGENIEIEALLADDLGIANVDRAQVESALLNLAVNARDAMPTGGRLLIETANVDLDAEYIRLHDDPELTPGAYVMLAVSDTGSGIAPEHLKRVFEPFFTTKGIGKGTGLGLSMVFGFVKQSKGHVALYSELGRGTTVRLYLPRVQTKPDLVQRLPQSMARGHENILLVEDEELVRKSVASQLRSLGYGVTDLPNGKAALEWLARGLPVDLLLTDVVMPEMDGPSLVRAASAMRPGLKSLYMSGYSENSPALRNAIAADAALLSKPFRKVDLATRVRKVLTM